MKCSGTSAWDGCASIAGGHSAHAQNKTACHRPPPYTCRAGSCGWPSHDAGRNSASRTPVHSLAPDNSVGDTGESCASGSGMN